MNNGFFNVLNKFPFCLSSFLQAEADCTKAINLDKKVSFYPQPNLLVGVQWVLCLMFYAMYSAPSLFTLNMNHLIAKMHMHDIFVQLPTWVSQW